MGHIVRPGSNLRGNPSAPSGSGYISGTSPGVTVNGTPAARYVEVRDRTTRQICAVVFSGVDGKYTVYGLNTARTYDVIARDWGNVYNDVIRGNVTPKS